MTETKTIHTQQDIDACLVFIREYHKLEKGTHLLFQDHVKKAWGIEDSRHSKIEYLCRKWKDKKKDFGALWFGLDTTARVKMYMGFGIDDQEALSWGAAHGGRISAMFVSPSKMYSRIHNLQVFFNNHGISETPTGWLTLSIIPQCTENGFDPKNPCFGNSRNWAAYLNILGYKERYLVVETILNNYQLQQYTQ